MQWKRFHIGSLIAMNVCLTSSQTSLPFELHASGMLPVQRQVMFKYKDSTECQSDLWILNQNTSVLCIKPTNSFPYHVSWDPPSPGFSHTAVTTHPLVHTVAATSGFISASEPTALIPSPCLILFIWCLRAWAFSTYLINLWNVCFWKHSVLNTYSSASYRKGSQYTGVIKPRGWGWGDSSANKILAQQVCTKTWVRSQTPPKKVAVFALHMCVVLVQVRQRQGEPRSSMGRQSSGNGKPWSCWETLSHTTKHSKDNSKNDSGGF